MKRTLFVGLVCLASVDSVAEGQVGRPGAAREVVVSASGTPHSPWVEREICRKTTGTCEIALMNPETGEIARMGDALGTDFERTGNDDEIRRVETAMDKAIRLKAEK